MTLTSKWLEVNSCALFCPQVVVKFIKKARIVSECWVEDPDMGRVSQEISILARLDHPNIVKVRLRCASPKGIHTSTDLS